MSSTANKAILLVVAAGIVLGGGIGFIVGVSGWGILAGIVLAIIGAALVASEATAWAALTTDQIEQPKK
jgi:hypothetical protein